jgi:hypothetical protein
MCQPPAADPVSVWMATVLNSSWTAVAALLSHAAALRSAGAASLSATAHSLQATDETNAAAITAGQPSAAAATMPAAVAAIPAPTLPPLPALPPPPAPLPGEQLAALVHSGPGPATLRDTASELRATASRVSALADDTRRYRTLVDTNWQDGQQQAGTNIADHARWLDDVNQHLTSLADGADQAARHTDTLIEQTPKPEEFEQARHQVALAIAQFKASGGLNPIPVTTATAHLAKKQSQAVAAQETYHVASTATAAGLPPTPAPAPPIVRGEPAHKKQDTAKKKPEPDTAGEDTTDGQDPAQPETPPHEAPATQAAGPVPVTDPSTAAVPAMVAQIAGTLVGAGTGTLGQLASGLQGAAAAPLSALSSLTSGLGDSGTSWDPPHSLGADPAIDAIPDAGSSDPTGDGGGTGATTPAGAGPVSGPAVSAVPVSTAMPAGGLGGAAGPQTGTAGPGIGGMGMMPPMMGGMGGRPAERERDGKDRRVVLRPEPNTEPVFGELDRRRSRRTQQQQEGDK